MTQDEARDFLISLLPPGSENLYDLEPGSDLWLVMDGLAQFFVAYAFNLLDKLGVERFPSTNIDKLPDWEGFLGLAKFAVARFGTIAQRQTGVVARIRERGPFDDSTVAAIVGALLGYAPTTPVEIIKCARDPLTGLHTYGSTAWVLAAGATAKQWIYVNDGGKVSRAGVRILINNTVGTSTGPVTFTLVGPDGTTKTWTTAIGSPAVQGLFGVEFAGKAITGAWVLTMTVDAGASGPAKFIPQIFVEGIGPGQATGGAIWYWGVYADPAHVGEQGFSDYAAALAAIERIKHSHGHGALILSLTPRPGVSSGVHAAIPGMCIPTG